MREMFVKIVLVQILVETYLLDGVDEGTSDGLAEGVELGLQWKQ